MSTFNYLDLKTNTDTSNSSRLLKAGCEEPHSGVLWVGRWSSGDVEFYSQKQQSDMGGGERGHAVPANFTPPNYRLQDRGEGSKRMIRKWIRLSPFPLSHQPGKEIQRGNLRRKKNKWKSPKIEIDREKRADFSLKENTKTLRDAGNNATFDTNADLRSLWY